jgi:hypothetical protein
LKKILFIFTFLFLSFGTSFAKDDVTFKIGVNRFAWYAALQSINFMPLVSADPFTGVIITDWKMISDNEKYKLDIYILEETLTSNTIDVRVFKQKKINGVWVDDSTNPLVKSQIEDSILNTARKLRIEYILGNK